MIAIRPSTQLSTDYDLPIRDHQATTALNHFMGCFGIIIGYDWNWWNLSPATWDMDCLDTFGTPKNHLFEVKCWLSVKLWGIICWDKLRFLLIYSDADSDVDETSHLVGEPLESTKSQQAQHFSAQNWSPRTQPKTGVFSNAGKFKPHVHW